MYPSRPGAAPPRPTPRKPGTAFQPTVYNDLKKGIDLLANAIRPTLGPLPRLVVIERNNRSESPEFLDDGGTIGRRIIQVKGRGVDVGAMLLRHLAWQMNKTVGDGSATMAVIFQSLVTEGIRAVINQGCNPMLLRLGLERSVEKVCSALRDQAEPVLESEEYAGIARGLCQGDDEMAAMLAEMMDIVGKDGFIEIQNGSRVGLEREYVEGAFWDSSGWFSSTFQTDIENHRALMEDPSIFISDLQIKHGSELVPLLEMAVKAKIRNLVVITFQMADDAMGLLIRNNKAKTINVLPVRTPKISEVDRTALLEDIAVLTGGKVFHSAASDTTDDVRLEHLGSARIGWANDTYFGVIGGKGDARLIRQYVSRLRDSLPDADEEHRPTLQKRLGRLIGGSVILKVGGKTETEANLRKVTAERAVLALRNAAENGIVLGSGRALLNCQEALGSSADDRCDEDAAARHILSRALEEPLRVIAGNAGFPHDSIIDKVKESGDGCGFDARTGKIVDLFTTGIVDALNVLEMALQVAVSGAAMVLTTDAIVYRKLPPEIMEP